MLRILALVACLLAAAQPAQAGRELNVSYVKAPFNLQVMVMKSKGLLETALAGKDVAVHWYPIESGAKQAEAMAAGSLDVASVINSASVLLAASAGNPVRVARGVSRPEETFAIMVRADGPENLAGLRGKTIAGPKGTVLHQLLVAALDKAGLTESDVKFLSMDPGKASVALLSGQVDAGLLAGGIMLKAADAGARTLTTARGLVTPLLVVGVRTEFADKEPDLLAAYLAAHEAAMRFIETDLEAALAIGAAEQDISLEEARELYRRAGFATVLTDADVDGMRKDLAFLVDHGLAQRTCAPRELFLPQAFAPTGR
jgi:ABC-type nitrate/sulfonate/bicarbonate transport system substrate-binding protein